MIIPVILCGGIGSRLWPLSRIDHPKQFLKLQNNKSLLQETVSRISDNAIFMNPIIICGEKDKFKVASELEAINVKPYAILLEPQQRNTAAAISAAAIFIKTQFQNSQKVLLLPADHSIHNKKAFINAISTCKDCADRGILTFGIAPTHAATGYGYIKKGKRLSGEVYQVDEFIEKPDIEKAKTFIESKEYFWNSGMFLINNDVYIKELEELNYHMFTHVKLSVEKSKKSFDFIELNNDSFSKVESISFDVAVLEKTKHALLCPIKIDWLDLGNWESIYASMIKDSDNNGNVIVGNKIYIYKCQNNLFYSDGQKHLILNKLENLCVINTADAVLVTHKNHTEDIKDIYIDLKQKKVDILQISNKSYRPWGYYAIILDTPSYKIKSIHIAPKQQISLQYHLKRSEHWVITKGVATVTKGDKIFELRANESTHIAEKEIHKIENKTFDELELIEIQIGKSLTEDDIIRLEDKYDRIKK